MNNDFGPDSGLFLRSTEDGKSYQAMIDYHAGGNLMGIYGEGLGGKPHVRNFDFRTSVTEIEPSDQARRSRCPVTPEDWPKFWKHGEWNELRARIVGNPPTITTWIKGVKFMEWTGHREAPSRRRAASPCRSTAAATSRSSSSATATSASSGSRPGTRPPTRRRSGTRPRATSAGRASG